MTPVKPISGACGPVRVVFGCLDQVRQLIAPSVADLDAFPHVSQSPDLTRQLQAVSPATLAALGGPDVVLWHAACDAFSTLEIEP